ncbi:hypothetical protein M9H77_02238 [Catharanthus roseus]|uniref:Uncharacterized protein n=1 Tax=Catharanthus roseus TaxID=4058 RepID=A0ACC0C8C2_CATRO|nr:hypothetical protein M9H77_02238 [Catharanthus roseus]
MWQDGMGAHTGLKEKSDYRDPGGGNLSSAIDSYKTPRASFSGNLPRTIGLALPSAVGYRDLSTPATRDLSWTVGPALPSMIGSRKSPRKFSDKNFGDILAAERDLEKSKRASSNPTPNVLPVPEYLTDTAREWFTDKASLNMIVKKSFGEAVIEHFRLENLFRGFGWVPLLRLSGDYYPDLVREFYTNMLHKMDKDLPTIISQGKGVRIIVERDRVASILGIPDNRNTVTVDQNRRSIDEDPDWNFDAAYSRFNIQHRALYRSRIIGAIFHPSSHGLSLTSFVALLLKKGADLVKSIL